MGSSHLVEFFIAILVGFLAVLGAIFCVGFLLVEPIRSPPSKDATTSVLASSGGCGMVVKDKVLPMGCTLNGESVVPLASCSQDLCTCNEDQLAIGSVCCCLEVQRAAVNGLECANEVFNTSACGCTSCNDIEVTVNLIIEEMGTHARISAAQVYIMNPSGGLTSVGITNNNGLFSYSESVGERTVVFTVQAVGFISQSTGPILLFPNNPRIQRVIVLMPNMDQEVGMGSSDITLQLNTMLSVSAPADVFRTADGEMYEGMVTFRGGYVDVSNEDALATLPFSNFAFRDSETGETRQFSMLAGYTLVFTDDEGMPLQLNGNLTVNVSLHGENEADFSGLCILTYDPLTDTWSKSDLRPVDQARSKRQTNPIIFFGPNSNLELFSVIASLLERNCWMQARGFQENGVDSAQNTIITMEQNIMTSGGDERLVRFSGQTSMAQTNTDGLNINALCLPLVCENIINGMITAKENNDMPLVPVDFNDTVFDANVSAPVAISTAFLFNEGVTADTNRPSPFYSTLESCRAQGQEVNTVASAADFFKFIERDQLNAPTPINRCFIKIQIRDCFANNSVTVTSSRAGSVVQQTTFTVMPIESTTNPLTTRMDTTQMETTQMDTTQMDTTRMDTTQMDTTRMDTTRMDTTQMDTTQTDATTFTTQGGTTTDDFTDFFSGTGPTEEVTTPEITTPETTTPEMTTPEMTTPEMTTPEMTTPETTTPETTTPETTTPETTTPETTTPETTTPETTTPEATTPPGPFVCTEAAATLRAACLRYECGSTVEIVVNFSPEAPNVPNVPMVCTVTDRSVNLQAFSTNNNINDQLIVETEGLLVDDFNDPDLGLYTDVGGTASADMLAEERCFAGLGPGDMSSTLDINTGAAAEFSCF